MRIVDTREPENLRYKLLETGWEQKILVSGDFTFTTHDELRVGVTRKAIQDLLNSVLSNPDNIFAGQLEEMLDYYDITIIIIEGSWQPVIEKRIHKGGVEYPAWDLIWNWLHRWFAKGFILDLTISLEHTIHRLNTLYALYQKPYSMNAKSKRFSDDRILALPSGVRGSTGNTILRACGSLKTVANLETNELETIPGVGYKKAVLIYNHFNRES